jgi:tRNA(Arg) A34 adenosine deaminase TadA
MKTLVRVVRIIAIGVGIVSTVVCFLLVYPLLGWDVTGTPARISPVLEARLKALGEQSLVSNDVPVAAVVMYGDSIIGEGYNTVNRDDNCGGHAEINALSSAMHCVGREQFNHLNRDSVSLISTFEPCPMCCGAILEHHITRVTFLKPKPFLYLLKEEARLFLAGLRSEHSEPSALQDSLFEKHPSYPHH